MASVEHEVERCSHTCLLCATSILKHTPGSSFSFLSVCTALAPYWTTGIEHLVCCVHCDWYLHISNCCINTLNFLIILCYSVNTYILLKQCYTHLVAVLPLALAQTLFPHFVSWSACLFPYQSQLQWRVVLGRMASNMTIILPTNIAPYKLRCYSWQLKSSQICTW